MVNSKTTGTAQHVPIQSWLPWLTSVAEIPRLEVLCTTIRPSEYAGVEVLESEVREAAVGWARLFRRAAKEYGLTLLSCEMSVIADKRRQTADAQSFFTSYISIFSEEAEALHRSYKIGFERGSRPDDPATQQYLYQDPIVVHPELFAPATGYFYAAFQGAPTGQPDEIDDPVLYAYGFPLEGVIGGGEPKVITRQLDDFVELFQGNATDAGVGSELSGATLALVPFVRPEFEIAEAIPGSARRGATPGGCIFFIFREQVPTDAPELRGFLRSVRWVLAEASATESQSAFDASAQRQELTAGMLHGTVTAIRSISSAALRDMLIHAEADRTEFGIDDLIVDFPSQAPTVTSHKEALIRQLKRMVAAEDVAASLIGFAEIRADRGVVRRKFQSDVPTGLRALVDRAWFIARRGERDGLAFSAGRLDDAANDWELPSGYISERLLCGLLMELFRNAIDHGRPDNDNENGVSIQVAIFEDERGVLVRIQNLMRVSYDGGAQITGFISRTQLLLEDIPGLGLDTFPLPEEDGFVSQLRLGAISRTREGESRGRLGATEFVAPTRQAASK